MAGETGTAVMANLVTTVYDRLVEFALRAEPTFRALVDKQPEQQAMPGSTVNLEIYATDLAPATTPLTELVDPDFVALTNPSIVPITLQEYGKVVSITRKLELLALSDVDPAAADLVAWNIIDTLDELVQTQLRAGTNIVREAGGVRSTSAAITAVLATDKFQSRDIRLAVANMRTAKARYRKASLYAGVIHPQVGVDLREETGAAAWRDPHVYNAPDGIWAGEVGQYEGVAWVENPRCYNAVDGGAGGNTVRVFRTYILGQQAIAQAVADEPHVVIGEVTSPLRRFRPLGWTGNLGFARYREAAIYRIESSSSVNSA